MAEVMEHQDVFEYIKSKENDYRTVRIPLTNSKDWNMYEHIQRCKNVANAWYHQGANDGKRPYDDIVTPIVDVAIRSEGFDVKDIVPYVNDAQNYYKSFLIKKYHPQWARKNELDTFIDEVVENSVIFDLALIKNLNQVRPEVVDLTTIAFCNQINVMLGPICLKHSMSVAEIVEQKGKWDSDKIDQAILMSSEEMKVAIANDQQTKLPSKNIEVYELRGDLPELWIDETGEMHKYVPQMQIVCYYNDKEGNRKGITLFKGKDKPLSDNFKALKIDSVRSEGRACGRSVVERLFEPQVWNNYSGIKIKEMLDSALNIFQTDSEEYKGQKLSSLKTNTVLGHETNKPITKVNGDLQNLTAFTNHQIKQQNSARELGSASEASLGKNPVSGTPFALQNLIVQEGQGMHDYRQGKIATFFADVLYRDWILGYLVKDMNKGKKFSEELTFEEMQELVKIVSENEANQTIKQMIIEGKEVNDEVKAQITKIKKDAFFAGGTRRFFETLENELKDLPVDVFVNISGKQKRMAENADKISNLITKFLQAGVPLQNLTTQINELLENSDMSPINFPDVITPPEQTQAQPELQVA